MKKLTALLLALLMITSTMVFGVSATDAMVADDALRIVPLSDCTGPSTVLNQGAANVSGEGWFGNGSYVDGAYGVSIDGIPTNQSSGNVIQIAYHTSDPVDITDMTMLEFDLYLENAPGVANNHFEIELRSFGWTNANGDRSERNYTPYLNDLTDDVLKDGWNHIEIPLSNFSAAPAAFDPTQMCYIRIFNRGGNAPTQRIGSEGKTTVMRLDNVYFSNKAVVTPASNDNFFVAKGTVHNTLTSASGNAAMSFSTVLPTSRDITSYDTFAFDVYLGDLAAAQTKYTIELTSSGTCDNEEDNIGGDTLAKLAARANTTLTVGWNRIELPLCTRALGSLDETAFDYNRFYSAPNPAYGDNANHIVAVSRRAIERQTGDLINLWSTQTGQTNWDISCSPNRIADVVSADGTLEADGTNEWVWASSASEFTYDHAEAVAEFKYEPKVTAFPWKNFCGLQFDIFVSDAAFGEMPIVLEMTSAKTFDKEEREGAGSLNSLANTTLEAGKWQTISVPVEKLKAGGLIPAEFDYFRIWCNAGAENSITFANGLTVAVRNLKALNYVDPTETAKGEPIINMSSFSKGAATVMTGSNGNPNNKVAKILDVAAGGELVKNTAAIYSFDYALTAPVDASMADHIAFDLYLENSASWIDIVPYLFGVSSYGNCDAEQITAQGTLRQMFGNYVVNADGTKGELKDGWNRIEGPLYSILYSDTRVHSKDAIDLSQIDFFRFYVTRKAETVYAEKKSFAAVDNITFFDGGVVGTRDNVVDYGLTGTITLYNGATESGKRVEILSKPFDISDKNALVMDVYLEGIANLSTDFILEIGSVNDCDRAEKETSFTKESLGITEADEGTWKTVRIPLENFIVVNSEGFDEKAVDHMRIYPAKALGADFVMKVDNVRFETKSAIVPAITSAQPTLTETINLTTKMNVPASVVNNPTVQYKFTGAAGTTLAMSSAELVSTSTNGKVKLYQSGFEGIPAHRMTDTLTMTLWYLDANGALVKNAPINYSVQQYAKNMLTAYADNAKLVTLLSDLLAYGAAAQIYATDYNADNLATNVGAGLTLTPSTYTAPEALTEVLVGTATDDDYDATFKSATLVLDGTVHIRYTFSANTTEGLSLTVNDKTYTAFETNEDGNYYVDVPVYANNFGTVYTASFGANTEYCVNYSVNHYVAKMHPTAGTKLAALLEALCNYGASASAYGAQ